MSGKEQLALTAYEAAIVRLVSRSVTTLRKSEGRKTQAIGLEYQRTRLLETCGRWEDAARAWAYLITSTQRAADSSDKGMRWLRVQVSRVYGRTCLDRAFSLGSGSPDASYSIEKLQEMCSSSVLPGEQNSFIDINHAAIFLGSWYHHLGLQDQCRRYLSPYVQQNPEALSPDTRDCHSAAYNELLHVLLAAGDEFRAFAAAQSFRSFEPRQNPRRCDPSNEDLPVLESEHQAAQQEWPGGRETEVSDNDRGHWPVEGGVRIYDIGTWWTCVGRHLDYERYLLEEDAYECRICPIILCKDCVRCIKEGWLKEICDSTHEHLRIPVLTDEQYGLLQDHTRVIIGGQLVSLEDFREGLRRDWTAKS